MKNKRAIWLSKLAAFSICVVMAAEPAVIYADSFSDGTVSVIPDESAQIPENAEIQQLPDEEDFTPGDEEAVENGSGFDDGWDDDFDDGDEEEEDDMDPSVLRSGPCGDNATWSFQNGVLTIEGTGEVEGWYELRDWITGELTESRKAPWIDFASSVKEVYVKDGVTELGHFLFGDLPNLEKVVLADTVKIIGNSTFANDKSLTDITLGNSVEQICDDAFHGVGATKLVLPASVTDISDLAFNGLWELQTIEMPDNGKYRSEDGVLYADKGKTIVLYPAGRRGEYTIPSKVTKIAANAFLNTRLTSITVPATVKKLGEYAFSYSDDLQSIKFMGGTAEIPDSCCYYDNSLTDVTIAEGVTTIADYAFRACESLNSVTLPTTVRDVGNAFDRETKVTFLNSNLIQTDDGSYINGVKINVNAKEVYSKAFEVLDIVNKERKKAGLAALKMDVSLLDTAMLRGFENVLYWSHTRPNGSSCFTANDLMMGENIAYGSSTAEGVMNMWMNSEGHRANILTARFTSIGIGCVYYEGTYYWVQCFGEDLETEAVKTSYKDRKGDRTVLVKNDSEYYKASLYISKTSLKKGETAKVRFLWDGSYMNNSGVVFESSDPSVCTVNNGVLTAVGNGKAKITMYFEGNPETAVSKNVSVTTGAAKKLKVTFNANGGTVATKSKTVTINSKLGKLPIPRRNGYTFTGWYTAKSKGKKVSTSTRVTKKLTLYAHWKKK